MSEFIKNAIPLFETGKPGACPYCGSKNLNAEEMVTGTHYATFFECPDCKQYAHFDGRIDPDDPNWHKNKK